MNESKKTNTKWIIGSLALSMLLASMGVSIPNVALPALAKEFGASFAEVQSIVLSYLLAITVTIVGAGRIGDLFGRRRILLSGILIFMVGAILGGFASTLPLLNIARVIQGIGAATVMALTVAFISDSVEKEKIGGAMGLMGTMSAIGTASGPTIGGIIITNFGWHGVFFFMSILGALTFYLSLRFLPTIKSQVKDSRKRFDIVGMSLLGVTLAAYSLGVSVTNGHFGEKNLLLIALAAIAGSVFILLERKVEAPLIRLTAFKNLDLTSNLLMNGLVSTVMMSTLVVGPFYLSQGLGLSALVVGIVMSVGPMMSIISGFPAGKLVDTIGTKKVTRIGLSLMTIGVGGLSVLPQLIGMIGYILSVAILSPGYQLFQASNNTSVMTNVSTEERGVFSGLLSLSRNIGLITGASAMGAVFSAFSDASQISNASPDSVTTGMRATFLVATLLVLFALTLSVFLKSNRKEKNEKQFA